MSLEKIAKNQWKGKKTPNIFENCLIVELINCVMQKREEKMGGWDQNRRTDFEITVIRPEFHR